MTLHVEPQNVNDVQAIKLHIVGFTLRHKNNFVIHSIETLTEMLITGINKN